MSLWDDTAIVGAFLADFTSEDTGAAFVYTIDSAPGTACSVVPSFRTGTLNLDFTLASSTLLQWELWLSFGSSTVRLWSVPLPAGDPPVTFSYPIPGFPMVGRVSIGSTLTSTTNGRVCTDWSVVETGVP